MQQIGVGAVVQEARRAVLHRLRDECPVLASEERKLAVKELAELRSAWLGEGEGDDVAVPLLLVEVEDQAAAGVLPELEEVVEDLPVAPEDLGGLEFELEGAGWLGMRHELGEEDALVDQRLVEALVGGVVLPEVEFEAQSLPPVEELGDLGPLLFLLLGEEQLEGAVRAGRAGLDVVKLAVFELKLHGPALLDLDVGRHHRGPVVEQGRVFLLCRSLLRHRLHDYRADERLGGLAHLLQVDSHFHAVFFILLRIQRLLEGPERFLPLKVVQALLHRVARRLSQLSRLLLVFVEHCLRILL